jgi:thiamine thiazole synthase
MIDEIKISKAIIGAYTKKLTDHLCVDVAIAGAGPSGMVCAYYLAKKGKKVAIFERKLSVGGGMWGGGIMFNEIVVQTQAKKILDEFGIRSRLWENGYYLADSIEATATLCAQALKAGAAVFNCMSAEDIMIRKNRVCGLVLNWTAVEMARLHVDPITMRASYVVDGTGHDAQIVRIAEKKSGIRLKTKTGKAVGEGSMWAEIAETTTVKIRRKWRPASSSAACAPTPRSADPVWGPFSEACFYRARKPPRSS